MQFNDTWQDTEKLMLAVVGTISGHARRMNLDKDNKRAPLQKALVASGEKLRTLREQVAKLMGRPDLAAVTLAVGLKELIAAVPPHRIDGALVAVIAEMAFDGHWPETTVTPPPVDEDIIVDEAGEEDKK